MKRDDPARRTGGDAVSRVRPVALEGVFILLSASFREPRPDEKFPPVRPNDVAEAATAVARGVLATGGRLVFGGHPTITPLVLQVATSIVACERLTDRDRDADPRVIIYQSRLYEGHITRETRMLDELGHGHIEWVNAVPGDTLERNARSLERLRFRMLDETRPAAGFFLGGAAGIAREREAAVRLLGDDFTPFALTASGGAAATLPAPDGVDDDVRELLASRSYPAAVQAALSSIRR